MEPKEKWTVVIVFRKSLKRHGKKKKLVLSFHFTVKNNLSKGIKIPSFIRLYIHQITVAIEYAALTVNITLKTPRQRL